MIFFFDHFVAVFRKFDTYGGKADGPDGRPKTVIGGVLSGLFTAVVLVMIILSIFCCESGVV
jgi:hypothetical protein